MNKNSGFASVIILAVAIAILFVAIVLYGLFQSEDSNIINNTFNTQRADQEEMISEEVSESDDVETLEMELEETVIIDYESEFETLDDDAGTL